MMMVPAPADPCYWTGDVFGADTLKEIFDNNPCAFQKIRAFPFKPGGLAHFGCRVVHWGSDGADQTARADPRIAMSWVVGDGKFERRAFKFLGPDGPIYPTVQERVALCAAQLIAYSGQTGIRRHEKNMYFRIFSKEIRSFNEEYIDKIRHLNFLRDAIPPSVANSNTATTSKPRAKPQVIIPANKEDEMEKAESVKLLFGSSDSDSD